MRAAARFSLDQVIQANDTLLKQYIKLRGDGFPRVRDIGEVEIFFSRDMRLVGTDPESFSVFLF